MILTTFRHKNSNFDRSFSLPTHFVGKEVYVLFYIDEEVKITTASILSAKKPFQLSIELSDAFLRIFLIKERLCLAQYN